MVGGCLICVQGSEYKTSPLCRRASPHPRVARVADPSLFSFVRNGFHPRSLGAQTSIPHCPGRLVVRLCGFRRHVWLPQSPRVVRTICCASTLHIPHHQSSGIIRYLAASRVPMYSSIRRQPGLPSSTLGRCFPMEWVVSSAQPVADVCLCVGYNEIHRRQPAYCVRHRSVAVAWPHVGRTHSATDFIAMH